MSSGERPIGAAKGKQSDTEALCQTPPPGNWKPITQRSASRTRVVPCFSGQNEPWFLCVCNLVLPPPPPPRQIWHGTPGVTTQCLTSLSATLPPPFPHPPPRLRPQCFVYIATPLTTTSLTVDFSGMDDGSRVTVLNSVFPAGVVVDGSYVYYHRDPSLAQGTADLKNYITMGWNRIVITQVHPEPRKGV